MEVVGNFFAQHWLSLTLFAGATYSVWLVRKNWKKLQKNRPV